MLYNQFLAYHTPQSVGRKLTTLRERCVRIAEVKGSNPSRSTIKKAVKHWFHGFFVVSESRGSKKLDAFSRCGIRKRRLLEDLYYFNASIRANCFSISNCLATSLKPRQRNSSRTPHSSSSMFFAVSERYRASRLQRTRFRSSIFW